VAAWEALAMPYPAAYCRWRQAEALDITEKTASVHVSNILHKLGVASRGEAAAEAYRRGLVG
jgi:FixJ family two-component response regulator